MWTWYLYRGLSPSTLDHPSLPYFDQVKKTALTIMSRSYDFRSIVDFLTCRTHNRARCKLCDRSVFARSSFVLLLSPPCTKEILIEDLFQLNRRTAYLLFVSQE